MFAFFKIQFCSVGANIICFLCHSQDFLCIILFQGTFFSCSFIPSHQCPCSVLFFQLPSLYPHALAVK